MNTKDVNIKRKNLSWLLAKNRLIEQLGLNVFRYEKDKRSEEHTSELQSPLQSRMPSSA